MWRGRLFSITPITGLLSKVYHPLSQVKIFRQAALWGFQSCSNLSYINVNFAWSISRVREISEIWQMQVKAEQQFPVDEVRGLWIWSLVSQKHNHHRLFHLISIPKNAFFLIFPHSESVPRSHKISRTRQKLAQAIEIRCLSVSFQLRPISTTSHE